MKVSVFFTLLFVSMFAFTVCERKCSDHAKKVINETPLLSDALIPENIGMSSFLFHYLAYDLKWGLEEVQKFKKISTKNIKHVFDSTNNMDKTDEDYATVEKLRETYHYSAMTLFGHASKRYLPLEFTFPDQLIEAVQTLMKFEDKHAEQVLKAFGSDERLTFDAALAAVFC